MIIFQMWGRSLLYFKIFRRLDVLRFREKRKNYQNDQLDSTSLSDKDACGGSLFIA